MNFESCYIYIPQILSTNTRLKEMLVEDSDMPGFTFLYAGFQTAGRGQRGNSWESEPDKNLLFSCLLRPEGVSASSSFIISQIASLAIFSTLGRYAEGFTIKWPNDIYFKDKKICGMLIENSITGDLIESSIIGVGINVNQKKFTSPAPNPVSLIQIIGREVCLEDLLKEVSGKFVSYYRCYLEEGTNYIYQDYLSSLYRGKGYYPYESRGVRFKASIKRVNPDGSIVLLNEDGTEQSYTFKEVSFIV